MKSLSSFELEIQRSFENGEFQSVATKAELEKFKMAAWATLSLTAPDTLVTLANPAPANRRIPPRLRLGRTTQSMLR